MSISGRHIKLVNVFMIIKQGASYRCKAISSNELDLYLYRRPFKTNLRLYGNYTTYKFKENTFESQEWFLSKLT